ncbi:phosphoribosyltransferase [Marisediminicola senii]|uniref:phosphoribosyltransferase n=1 Tax=Marisediminicola senii TaxID=2711233 RepID=UPI0013ECBC53|nr:phosphoribosyltransferase [Marisediminicola senii]
MSDDERADTGQVVDERETLGWDEFGEAARLLAADILRSGFRPDVVVAIARGGLLLAGAVAYALDVKSCGALNVEFYTGVDARLPEPVVLAPLLDSESLDDKRVLIVDDVSDSGRTLAMVVDLVARAGADARSVCLYSKPGTVLEPDFVWKSTSRWIDFPWSSLPPVTASPVTA